MRAQVLAAFDDLLDELGPGISDTVERLGRAKRDRLARNEYRVVVCGEFHRGKSSLLNGLVNRPWLFPVDANITTSAVMTLR